MIDGGKNWEVATSSEEVEVSFFLFVFTESQLFDMELRL
jgi:hypothetical protein